VAHENHSMPCVTLSLGPDCENVKLGRRRTHRVARATFLTVIKQVFWPFLKAKVGFTIFL
jgi:hypothetical protein